MRADISYAPRTCGKLSDMLACLYSESYGDVHKRTLGSRVRQLILIGNLRASVRVLFPNQGEWLLKSNA